MVDTILKRDVDSRSYASKTPYRNTIGDRFRACHGPSRLCDGGFAAAARGVHSLGGRIHCDTCVSASPLSALPARSSRLRVSTLTLGASWHVASVVTFTNGIALLARITTGLSLVHLGLWVCAGGTGHSRSD